MQFSKEQLNQFGFEFNPDPDQPGKFLWRNGDEGSELSFDSEQEAIHDAQRYVVQHWHDKVCKCDNCGALDTADRIAEAKHLGQRLDPGGVVPSGECRVCGALSYPLDISNFNLMPYRVMLREEAGDKHQLVFDCMAEDGDHAQDQAENASPGAEVISTIPFPLGDQPKCAIYSPSEAAASGGTAGFWSSEHGWTEHATATRFASNEMPGVGMPISTGNDARWIVFEPDFVTPDAMQANQVAHLKSVIEKSIARLREIAIDPVAIQYSEHVDFEVRPKDNDARILVGRNGWGFTTVNYTGEGLILDVCDEAAGNVHTAALYADDLVISFDEVPDVDGHVGAEMHSDDRVFEVSFNAAPWLQKATGQEIQDLWQIGWAHDGPADSVAEWLASRNDEISAALAYCKATQGLRNSVGFECSVNETEAMAWLRTHRKGVWAQIMCRENSVQVTKVTQRGSADRWTWFKSIEFETEFFDTEELAALDAVKVLGLDGQTVEAVAA